MKQSEMLTLLKELSSDLQRYAAGSDSIVPGAYVEALDRAIKTLDRIKWRKVGDELPEIDDPYGKSAHVLQCIKVTISDGWYRFATDAYCFPARKMYGKTHLEHAQHIGHICPSCRRRKNDTQTEKST